MFQLVAIWLRWQHEKSVINLLGFLMLLVVILSWDFNGKIICKGVKWYDLSLFFVGLWTASKDQRLLWSSWLLLYYTKSITIPPPGNTRVCVTIEFFYKRGPKKVLHILPPNIWILETTCRFFWGHLDMCKLVSQTNPKRIK